VLFNKISDICKQCRGKLKTELQSNTSGSSEPLQCDPGEKEKEELVLPHLITPISSNPGICATARQKEKLALPSLVNKLRGQCFRSAKGSCDSS